ncbi:MAG: PQQ-like beta-propeller repeat protein [Planctomycetes bacterium]|nr:PQQ-like beta-propeller repeat protein [Planctomycetota bacterium]
MRKIVLIIFLVLLVSGVVFGQENWTQFRGVAAGVALGEKQPTTWSETENVVWSVDVPGRGWSSPIVWGDRIYLTSVISEGEVAEARKGLYMRGEQGRAPKDVHHWMVFCLDWESGRVVWQKEVHKGLPEYPVHVKNTYASETPVTDGERVYAYFGNLGLFCFDMAGQELWSKKWGSFSTRYNWGPASSPVLHGERIYIVNDNEKNSFMVALDIKTGEEVWKAERDEKSNWATPFVWENEKRTEIVTAGTKMIRSYDLAGKVLWELGPMSSIAVPTSFAGHGLCYISSGYVGDRRNRPIYAVRPGASGDITLEGDQTSSEFLAWSHKQGGPYNPSPIVYGDYFYVLYDRGIVSCYDAKTGEVVYEGQRIDAEARAFTVSPWASDGKIFCLDENGITYVIAAGREFKVLGKNSLGEMCGASPATVRGNLIIRTQTKLYRIQEKDD